MYACENIANSHACASICEAHAQLTNYMQWRVYDSFQEKLSAEREIAQFLGLAYVSQTRVSTTKLFEAGLGEKEIEFNELDLLAQGVREGIIEISFVSVLQIRGS